MLGSLTFYRRILNESFFSNPSIMALGRASHRRLDIAKYQTEKKLPTIGHAIAGVLAGATVSFIAAPVEHVKARLQVQYAPDKRQRLYSGPIDCVKKIVGQFVNAVGFKTDTNHSFELTVYQEFTMAFQQPFYFGHSSSSGGVRMTS